MKTSQIPQPATERYGLFAMVESKRTILPLKGVECDFSVFSGVAEVSMSQVFRQENDKPLDCEYLFPLPADASVFFCEADINGRTIRAQVRERQEARRLAAEKKAAGFRTALVEAERENLFTLSLGNVQSGDLVVVQLKYFQTLRMLAGMPSLEIPFCPGVRYIPGKPLLRANKGKGVIDDTDEVPDASRITPVRIDAEHPDAAYIDVRGTLEAKFVAETDISSPSHAIAVRPMGEEFRVSLSEKDKVPDRDFVLRWREKNPSAVMSRAWVRKKADATYALLEIRAPECAPADGSPVDFYFLVDRSGSMAGQKWEKAAEALQSCVRVLGPKDRAMITFFESHFRDFAERPLSPGELLEDRHFQAVRELGTDGGTEMGPALKHVLELAAKYSDDRCRNLILITDAEIGNESAILKLMKTAPDIPVHCFGIDVALNDSLLLAMCRQQGGTFHSLNPNDNIEKAVTSLGKTLGQPVLLDLKLQNGWEPADARIPNLYAGQVHYLSARLPKEKPLRLTARTPSLEPVRLQFDRHTTTLEAPYLHWCRSRLQRLVAEGDDKAAIALSTASNLICPLTAFIAWDESEKVPIATHQLVQPSMALEHAALYCDFSAEELERLAAHAPQTAARFLCEMRTGLWRAPLDSEIADEVAPIPQTSMPDELPLRRELSDICHQAGVPEWRRLVIAIFGWIAEATGVERARRIEAVKELMREIRELLDRTGVVQGQEPAEQAKTDAHQLLKAFVEKLPARN